MQKLTRSLWLAAAATVLSAGMACAQNTPATRDNLPPGDQTLAAMTPPPVAAMPRHMLPAGAVPNDASLQTYLRIAVQAIHSHDKPTADTALSNAETLMLTRSVPQAAAIPVDQSPPVQMIEQARQALAAGDYAKAEALTQRLMGPPHPGMMPMQ